MSTENSYSFNSELIAKIFNISHLKVIQAVNSLERSVEFINDNFKPLMYFDGWRRNFVIQRLDMTEAGFVSMFQYIKEGNYEDDLP